MEDEKRTCFQRLFCFRRNRKEMGDTWKTVLIYEIYLSWSYKRYLGLSNSQKGVMCHVKACDVYGTNYFWQDNHFKFCKKYSQVDVHLRNGVVLSVHNGRIPRTRVLESYFILPISDIILDYIGILPAKQKVYACDKMVKKTSRGFEKTTNGLSMNTSS
jgi:hypothetical protein